MITLAHYTGSVEYLLSLDKENMKALVDRHSSWNYEKELEFKTKWMKRNAVYSILLDKNQIGFVIYTLDEVLFLKTIQVEQKHQGKGYGTQVMNILEALAKDSNCAAVELRVIQDNQARTFYEHLGYSIKEVQTNDLLWMRKEV